MKISDKINRIYAINKKTREIKTVNLIHIEQKTFNSSDDKEWGVWYNYSKRGDWDLFIDFHKLSAEH